MKNRVYNFTDRTGERHTTKEGYETEITKYTNANNVEVKFLCNGYVIGRTSYANIVKGCLKNPFHRSLRGVGFLGVGKYKTSINKKRPMYYTAWKNMFKRCYSNIEHNKNPSYKTCVVDPRWHCLQDFAEWFELNYVEGFELDKDILFKGNKIYSPETCCFVPHEINSLILTSKASRGAYPLGVYKDGNQFVARLTIGNGEILYVGRYNTVLETFDCYKVAKEKRIKKLANEWKGRIEPQVYNALINYQIEITD